MVRILIGGLEEKKNILKHEKLYYAHKHKWIVFKHTLIKWFSLIIKKKLIIKYKWVGGVCTCTCVDSKKLGESMDTEGPKLEWHVQLKQR